MKAAIRLMPVLIGLVVLARVPAGFSADEFYKGKTVHFIVGLAAGGGYDLAGRLVGRHIGKHIPGNPTVIVENMTGAGSLVAANYIANKAEPDGLTVGIWNSALVLHQALGDKAVRFDARKLGWIGAPTVGTPFCGIMGWTGMKTLQDVLASKKEIKLGATRAGSTYYDLPKILNVTLHTKFNVITGYTGTSTILLAMKSKEVEGGCWGWESARTTARAMLDSTGEDRLIPYLISSRWQDPEVKDLPLIPDVIKDKDNLAMYKTWIGTYEFQRPFMFPPQTPRERLNIFRKAFAETLKDPEFLAEAKKSKFPTTYVSGEQIDKYVDEMLSLSPKAKESLEFLIRKPSGN